jgi:hypothetical protein
MLFKLRFFGTLWSFHLIHFQKHMTGESDVSGKTVFNRLRSLEKKMHRRKRLYSVGAAQVRRPSIKKASITKAH